MDFHTYLKEALVYAVHHPEQRVGQAYMNFLIEVQRSDLYGLVRDLHDAGVKCDPFFDNDNLPGFFEALERNW